MIANDSQITEISVSSTEPVSTATAKEHLRVDISDDDTLIGSLITAAREYCEKYCNRSFVQHTYRADLPGFYEAVVLPYGPIQSISSVKYYDTSSPSTLQTLSTNVYRLFKDTVYRAHGESWEPVYVRRDAVQITYVTGWKDTSSPQGTGAVVPEAVKSAMLMIVADLYENREAQVTGMTIEANRTVNRLLNFYRAYQ